MHAYAAAAAVAVLLLDTAVACDVEDDTGMGWDLEELAGTRITTGPSDSPTYNWDYHFDVCGQIVQAPGCELSSAAVRNPTAPPSLCQDLAGPGPGVYTRIGDNGGLQVLFTETLGNSLTVQMTCDESLGSGSTSEPTPPTDPFTTGAAVIVWPTYYACDAHQQGGGLSRGGIILILMFLGAGLYAGGGLYYNQREKGMKGMEAFPHIDFWRQVPGLFKDGVLFTRVELSSRFPNQLSFLAPKDEDFKPLSRDDDFETKTPLTTGSAAAASSSASGKGTGKELVPAAAAASSSESETDSDDSDIAD